MLLVFDIGNTNVVVAGFDGATARFKLRIHTDVRQTEDEFGLVLRGMLDREHVEAPAVEAVVVSSVVPAVTDPVARAAGKMFGVTPLFLTPDLDLGLEIKVDNPHYVGADRLADAIAAGELHGGPAVIVDFGTATTVDAIDASGAYLGGAIAPGLETSHDALVARAALLPKIPLQPPQRVIGRNVVESMQAGLMLGYASMIDGLVRRAQKELGVPSHVIATGGLAEVMAGLTDSIDVVDSDLTLQGIRIAYERHTRGVDTSAAPRTA